MTIQQFKKSPIAYAPDALADCINKYSDHNSFVSNTINNKADIIHFNNKFIQTDKKQVIQYHSEPEKVILNYPGKKLVLGQYHCLLNEYKDCQIVRNIIDLEDKIYDYKEINKIRIGYSPSITKAVNVYYDKGYLETMPILERLKDKYKIEVDIITNVSLEECIERKSRCSIIIDECKTVSYHRSGLEGLALGKLTICSLSSQMCKVIKKISNSNYQPFENVLIDNLEVYLCSIIEDKPWIVNEIGYRNWEWMRKYWNHKDIVREFIKIYKEL